MRWPRRGGPRWSGPGHRALCCGGGGARAAPAVCASPRFRVSSHDDVIGVELGGALKNVIAIAAGILEGLGLGNNPRAALVTRGLAERSRLGGGRGGGT